MNRLSDAQIEALERDALKPYRSMVLPTTHVRQMIDEIRDLRDQVVLLQMKVDGSRAIIRAVEAAARADADTKLNTICIERPNGPPFKLIDALCGVRGDL